MIKILNYRNNSEINYPLILLFGQVNQIKLTEGEDQKFINCKYLNGNHKCSINKNGKFKFIFLLKNGLNCFQFSYKQASIEINLIFKKLPIRRCVKLYYITCSIDKNDKLMNSIFDEGKFQSKDKLNNSISNAKQRISLAMLMLQTFIASILPNRFTFDLELDEQTNLPIVEQFHCVQYSLDEFSEMTEKEMWRNLAIELLKLNHLNNLNFKYLAFLSFSRYKFDENKIKNSSNQMHYDELIKMTNCYVALGTEKFAALHSCFLFCWPEHFDEILDKFNDQTSIDTKLEFNNSNSNTYGDLFSTSLGSVLHELCHTFDLSHEQYGIMGTEFSLIKFYFLNESNEVDFKWFSRSAFLILSNHQFLNKNLKSLNLNDEYCFNIDSNSLKDDYKSGRLKLLKNQNFIFDQTKASLSSKNGVILIEYLNSTSHTLDHVEFNLPKKLINLSSNSYFKAYKSKDEDLNIIFLDTLGNIFKFK